ncbi:hypothetical protein AAFF_G00227200 [Aldrovandia affinis]|uniref:Uncharacterized protein n=1 Tax=Aldrovandia affinis TaxID=143900 RepID=A0AAD7TC20_9TELE|nr:hypothetical protein AAFF_G00227200 [Aldrovandia affinis]
MRWCPHLTPDHFWAVTLEHFAAILDGYLPTRSMWNSPPIMVPIAVFLVVFLDNVSAPDNSYSIEETIDRMEVLNRKTTMSPLSSVWSDIEEFEKVLENTIFEGSQCSITRGNLVAYLYKATGNFAGLNISGSDKQASSNHVMVNSSVHVHLPKSVLSPNDNRTIAFCMITAPKLYENLTLLYGKFVGVSISQKKVLGLADRIKITFSLQKSSTLQGDTLPECHFYNFSTEVFHKDGCITEWQPNAEQVVCSCDHLTYFAVLLVNPEISETDLINLTYISLVGCSLSLFFLVVTVILYIGHRKRSIDVSLKVHINLVAALILLNVHFLPSQQVASLSISGPCVYLAIVLHYSLLATFTWTAIEGFHLYLLLVRVFNIYIKRYLVKLGLVGWGLPAVVVAIIAIVDSDIYQRVTLRPSNNSTITVKMCYLQNTTVQMFNISLCGLVWTFSLIMLAVTCKLMVSLRSESVPGGKSQAWKGICSILGITCLLGITWGLVFFSFGQLPTPAIYLFCVLNSLQGFFIFLWICISKQISCQAPGNDSQNTRTTDAK